MAKPKAERWLTQSFADGVAERDWHSCWLAQHDPEQRPCEGSAEIFHFVNRQRVENALYPILPDHWSSERWWEVIHLACWDPRLGGIACEAHHRRLDSQAMPPLKVPLDALPAHVTDWAQDYGMEAELERRFTASERP